MTKEIVLLPHQKEAIASTAKKTVMICGIGAGKTFTGAVWTLTQLKKNPFALDLITANTYGQLQKSTLATCFQLYEQYNIPYVYNEKKSMLLLAGKKRFLCLSADCYDVHRGISVSSWWADELAYSPEESFKVFRGRQRDKRGALGLFVTTTPKGMNWIYDYFDPNGEQYDKENTHIIHAKTAQNSYLPESYESDLRREYGKELSRQELDAEFVKFGTGLAYYAFDQKEHVNPIEDKGGVVFIGLDFNVNPYCAVLSYLDGEVIKVFDEIYLENSNTPAMIKAIKEKIGCTPCRIVPDSTQFRRNTIGVTDIEMLRNHFEVLQSHNPFVIDRVNNTNRLFEQKRIIINKKCVKLINDLNKVTWKEKSLELDQVTQKNLTHMSDALGYLAYRLMPLHHSDKIVIGAYT